MTTLSGKRVQADESQFVIADASGDDLFSVPPIDDDLVQVVDGWVIVRTGAQWGPVEVVAASLEAAPAMADEWDDVVEVSVRCAGGLVVNELMGDPRLAVTRQGGELRVRVSARGRAAGAERWQSGPRSKILEFFLIETWPAPLASGETLRKAEPEEVDEVVVLDHEAAGRNAAARIYADLTGASGARSLSGRTGALVEEYEFAATRRKLFPQFGFDHLDVWAIPDRDANDLEPLPGDRPDWRLIHSRGEVRLGPLHSDPPRSQTVAWNWYLPDRTGRSAWMPFLAEDTTVRFDFSQKKKATGETATTVRVEHAALPIEWLDDMTNIWRWKLEQGHKIYNLGHY
jgi:hypothetical protein